LAVAGSGILPVGIGRWMLELVMRGPLWLGLAASSNKYSPTVLRQTREVDELAESG